VLGTELDNESVPMLVGSQRRTIEGVAGRRRRLVMIASIAAALLIAVLPGLRASGNNETPASKDVFVASEYGDQVDLEDSIDGYHALDRDDLITKDNATVQSSNSLDPASVLNPDGSLRLEFTPAANAAAQVWPDAVLTLIINEPMDPSTIRLGRSIFGVERFDRLRENNFRRVRDLDVSTFSIDVDTASYSNVRRYLLQEGCLPPPDAVRIEEMINYFPYDYAPPTADSEHPFAMHVELAACPWNSTHRLARVALKGKTMEAEKHKPANLVFLLDVSGSMGDEDKLPLLRESLKLLVDNLTKGDRVAIVVYAGASGLVLASTPNRDAILAALDRLHAGGSTNGGAGIQLAYDIAAKHFIKGGVNRVLLCTDGDFNVGITDRAALTTLIEQKAKSGVYLSVLGFGRGNYQDGTMEELSNRGNGNYAYIDGLREARKVLVEQKGGTLVTIAKDVKIQVFFNPARVAGWRLIGYENRLLEARDFNDDKKDAGEIGAGHTVTALYELVPTGLAVPDGKGDTNPFTVNREANKSGGDPKALFQLRVRYKLPDGTESILQEQFVRDSGGSFDAASRDFRWAASVAAFGMRLRPSDQQLEITWGGIQELAEGACGRDAAGHRREFLELCRKAAALNER